MQNDEHDEMHTQNPGICLSLVNICCVDKAGYFDSTAITSSRG